MREQPADDVVGLVDCGLEVAGDELVGGGRQEEGLCLLGRGDLVAELGYGD